MDDIREEKLSYVKGTAREPYLRMPVRNTIPKLLEYWASRQGQNEAFVFVDESSRLAVKWEDLYSKSKAVGNAMLQLGVKKNDFVMLYLKDSPEWLYVVYGAILAGARPVPFYYVDNTWENVGKVMTLLKTCSMLVLENTEDTVPIENILGKVDENGRVHSERFPYLKSLIYNDERDSCDQSKGKGNALKSLLTISTPAMDLPIVTEDDIAVCSISSGSTGPPKILSYTHKAFILGNIPRFNNIENYTGDDKCVYYNDRPFAWSGGYPNVIVYGYRRVTCTIAIKPSTAAYRLRKVIDVITSERCNMALFISSLLPQFFGVELPENWPMRVVKVYGKLTDKMLSLLGSFTTFFNIVYGSSELREMASWFIKHKEEYQPNCVGKIHWCIPSEVKIVDEDCQTVPLGVRGEIIVRNLTQFSCYVNDPANTRDIKTEDNWCRTDDIGMMQDENGEIKMYLYGRKSNIILTDENKIDPGLIEKAIEDVNSNIIQAIVVAVPDDIFYQVLCACVKVEPGCNLDVDYMKARFEQLQTEKPADFKAIPKHWMVVEHFPLLANGKLARRQLTKLAEEYVELKQ